MFCTACAAPNPPEARRCGACGAPLDHAAAAALLARNDPAPRSHPRLRRVARRLLVVGPLLLLALAVVVGADRYRVDQDQLAGWYARGVAADAVGRYPDAIAAFTNAAGYRDAGARRAAAVAQLAPLRAAYLDGLAALTAGQYDAAIADLSSVAAALPDYEDVGARLAEARQGQRDQLTGEADAAVAKHDWLTAERLLATLAAANPGDTTLADRLAELRRDHAPLLLTNGRQLTLIGPDLNDEQTLAPGLPAFWPTWSPDRRQIAFISFDMDSPTSVARLYTVAPDGSGLKQLASGVEPSVWPVWSPDGTRIAFASQVGAGAAGPRVAIHLVDVATGRERDLTGSRVPFAEFPSWSPGGDRLAFVSHSSETAPTAGIMDGGGHVQILTLATGAISDVSGNRLPNAVAVSWSPVGDNLLVYSMQKDTWYATAATGIALLDAGGGPPTQIGAPGDNPALPVWAPDGTRFAYQVGDSEVRVHPLAGRERFVTTPGSLGGLLTWAPDGQTLLAASADPRDPSYLIPYDGDQLGPPRPLTLGYDASPSYAGGPTWSPPQPLSRFVPPPPATPVAPNAR